MNTKMPLANQADLVGMRFNHRGWESGTSSGDRTKSTYLLSLTGQAQCMQVLKVPLDTKMVVLDAKCQEKAEPQQQS